MDRAARVRLKKLVQGLPRTHRDALLLMATRDLPYADAAALLGVPVGTPEVPRERRPPDAAGNHGGTSRPFGNLPPPGPRRTGRPSALERTRSRRTCPTARSDMTEHDDAQLDAALEALARPEPGWTTSRACWPVRAAAAGTSVAPIARARTRRRSARGGCSRWLPPSLPPSAWRGRQADSRKRG